VIEGFIAKFQKFKNLIEKVIILLFIVFFLKIKETEA